MHPTDHVLAVLADERRTAVARQFHDAQRVRIRHAVAAPVFALAGALAALARAVDDEPDAVSGTLIA